MHTDTAEELMHVTITRQSQQEIFPAILQMQKGKN